ncbi:MAG: PD-(D/E)XK nuclease family protein [Minisyncoccia bacterium]
MLKELIDKFYLDKNRDKNQTHFYITDAGKCPRSIFFKFKNAPREEAEARILRLYEHGDYIQMQMMNVLISLGLVRASEVNIPPQEIISGRADAILTLNNELYVVDFKSMNSMLFRELSEPKIEHINQIQLYLHYFKIPKGILLYVDKDTLALKEFFVDYNKELCDSLISDLEKLKEKIDKNIIPERLKDYPDNWQCRYCQFKEICKLAGKDTLDWEKFKEIVIKKNEVLDPSNVFTKEA